MEVQNLKTGGILTPDGVLLNYLVAGKGRKTVVVPNAVYLVDDFRSLSDEFTMIFYDLRGRGRSQSISDAAKLSGGVLNDAKDLEAIRKHFNLDEFSVVGHDYLGLMAAIYGLQFPGHLESIIQIGTVGPEPQATYSDIDAFSDSLSIKLANSFENLEATKATLSPKEYCEKWWSLQRAIASGAGAGTERIARGMCRYPNEFPDKVQEIMDQYVLPSIVQVKYKSNDYAKLNIPFLILHGQNDRLQPIGGSRAWANLLPNAELVEIETGGHFPWIERETEVFNAIRTFLR